MPLMNIALTALLAAAGDAAPVAPPLIPPPAVVGPASAEKIDHSDAHYQSMRRSIAFGLEHGHTPREWVLGWELLEAINDNTGDAMKRKRGALLRKAAEAAPKDHLVQWMWSSAEPEASGCDAQNPCPNRVTAFAKLEPDNGAAWVGVFNAAWNANDVPNAESALSHIAQATRFDEPIGDEFRAWEDYFQKFPTPDQALTPYEKVETSKEGRAFVEIFEAPLPAYYLLFRACDRAKQPDASAARFNTCGEVGRLMLERSNQFFGRTLGGALVRRSSSANAKDVETARSVRWQKEHLVKFFDRMSTDASAYRDYLDDFERTGSDVESIRIEMRRSGTPLMPPTDWQPTREGKPIDPLDQLLPPQN